MPNCLLKLVQLIDMLKEEIKFSNIQNLLDIIYKIYYVKFYEKLYEN